MKPADPEIGFFEDMENLQIGDTPRPAVVAVIHVEVPSGRVRWYNGNSIPARNPLPGLDPCRSQTGWKSRKTAARPGFGDAEVATAFIPEGELQVFSLIRARIIHSVR